MHTLLHLLIDIIQSAFVWFLVVLESAHIFDKFGHLKRNLCSPDDVVCVGAYGCDALFINMITQGR